MGSLSNKVEQKSDQKILLRAIVIPKMV